MPRVSAKRVFYSPKRLFCWIVLTTSVCILLQFRPQGEQTGVETAIPRDQIDRIVDVFPAASSIAAETFRALSPQAASQKHSGASDSAANNSVPLPTYVLAESETLGCPTGSSYIVNSKDCKLAILVVGGRNCIGYRNGKFGVGGPIGCFYNTDSKCVHFNKDNSGDDSDLGLSRMNRYICKRQRTKLISSAACQNVHPNADDPNMLHVAYASDIAQIDGVKASVASIVSSTSSPESLTVHIMVQRGLAAAFKNSFGVPRECRGTVTVTGILILIHELDPKLVQDSVAKVSEKVRKQRGAIDTLENFARFYMHIILDAAVAIYLDADTIVQADLVELRDQLVKSGKTIGFVARTGGVKMSSHLPKEPKCKIKGSADMDRLDENWNVILKLTAYNVGVVAINLQMWRKSKAFERVKKLVERHNGCSGGLWVGGSQPPLLLAFHNRPEEDPEDFIVFDAKWNFGTLGWAKGLSSDKIQKQFVLHWNGPNKPWLTKGYYQFAWKKHRDAFDTAMQPYESVGGAVGNTTDGQKDNKTRKSITVTRTPSPKSIAAARACPWVEVVREAPARSCELGDSFGCAEDSRSMWVVPPCAGLFYVRGKVTACTPPEPPKVASVNKAITQTVCSPAALPAFPKLVDSCNLMILTTFFTTKKDWQRGKYAVGDFAKIQNLYASVIRTQTNLTIIYDNLPPELIRNYSNRFVSFHRVDLTNVGVKGKFGVNDLRYFHFEKLIQENPSWGRIWIVDAFDVRIGMNPCSGMNDKQLYIGHEQDKLAKNVWMKARFKKMASKYVEWFGGLKDKRKRVLNCGITGGSRTIMLQLVRRMIEVISDPEHKALIQNIDVNVNMAALNYIAYNEFKKIITGGFPVHSLYKRFQTTRTDVWFVHK
eukprot:TRINITY_DN7552_c0_g1_i1.p1 TRINITY_DN7552_c0_g1~~TRINITY_DN7552_c0_g1_i1.p1  ORF type:complete len:883 (-),score=141.75 TRINITY_DN7552_c0_g1_i1:47-2695(-)